MLRWHCALIVGLVGACSGDILHSTEWESRCDTSESAVGCDGSPSSSSSGGEGGSGGESASSSSQSSSSAGGAHDGGSGGGGTGGEAPCQSCSEAVQGGAVDPNLPLCAGSQMALDQLLACICMACPAECATECASGWTMMGTDACMTCANDVALQLCSEQVQACLAN